MATRYPAFSATCSHLLLLLLLLLAHLEPTVHARRTRRSNAKFAPKEELVESQWEWISTMPRLNGPQFTNAALPLLQMCKNAYNFPYYHVNPDKQEQLIPIEGWSVSLQVPPAAPPRRGAAGIHALVYEETPHPFIQASPKVVVVFRGWQISSSSLDELADLCAGKLLFPNYVDFLSPPSHLCFTLFNKSSLDYLSQAIAYTQQVLQFYPSSSVLLTGHSFGEGLAVLVSAALQQDHACSGAKVGGLTSIFRDLSRSNQPTQNQSCSGARLPVVSFLGPGPRHQNLYDKRWTVRHTITISHEWDFFAMRAKWKGHRGWLCVYRTEEPDSCKSCFSDEQHLFSQTLLKPPQTLLKPNTSVDSVAKHKEKNDDDEDDDDDDCDEDDDDDDDDDDDCDDDDDDCDDDDDDDDCDDDDDDCDCDDDDDDCDDDDDDCDDDDDEDEDECPVLDEPCWDCLSATHAPESLLAVMEEFSRPLCIFLGRGRQVSAPTQKLKCSRRYKHTQSLTMKIK